MEPTWICGMGMGDCITLWRFLGLQFDHFIPFTYIQFDSMKGACYNEIAFT